MYKYKFLDHTADVGFEIESSSLNELFKASAILTFDVMADLKKVSPKITKKIKLKNSKIDNLLFNFIEELIFLKDSEYMLFSKFDIKITHSIDNGFFLIAEIKGEKINPKKHELKTDVKAITLHKFYVKKIKKKFKTSIILDI